ncbi:hypothetical protein LTR78_003789 [Recurvomyces mirabilis]|uniref:Apple domain-containing protein n=1 Tax=Recurvomyces mirabilis TaxID=574656 RepID=A0AAE1C3K8_9PEZI|nr:hypothetical protein LTR78_003789 [Recurvomyces mirabilis]KAK5154901.1 hypothetical protein LTS14_006482 [Recurvomyces mirabilis]
MPTMTSTLISGLAMLLASRAAADDSNMQCVLKTNPPAGAVCGTSGYLTNENSLDTYPFCEWHTDTIAAAGFYENSGSYYYGYDQACFTCGPKVVSCPGSDGQQFTVGAATFNIHCGTDYYGGDLSRVTSDTFEDCMTSCASTIGCIDVAYNGKNCYLKNSLQSPRSDSNVWGAVLASAEKGAAASTLSCPASNGASYTASSGAQFTVQCGVDYYGGDMGSAYVDTFAECLEVCDSTQGCLDVALHGHYCYLKNSVTSPQQNSDVWGAIKSGSTSRRDDAAVKAPTSRNTPGLKRKRDVAPTSQYTPNVADVQSN